MIQNTALVEMRPDIVTRQLDDVNVLGEALAAALRDGDAVRIEIIRASLVRYALAATWSRDRYLPAILAYANEHAEFEDDLFAPAFILEAIAPKDAETAKLVSAASDEVRALLARCTPPSGSTIG
jgi:hypothetical protein